MNIKTICPIYFSPTKTTRNVLLAIAHAIQAPLTEQIDLTLSDSDILVCREFSNDLAIIGSPVYAGRLPAVMLSRFKQIKGHGRPAVIVVVYGNRAYEDALIELKTPLGSGLTYGYLMLIYRHGSKTPHPFSFCPVPRYPSR